MKPVSIGDYHFIFETPSEQHFEINPIWCEFHTATELEDMRVPKDWLDENVYRHVDGTNLDVFYSAPPEIDCSKREFLYVSCPIEFGTTCVNGVVFIKCGEVWGFSLFLNSLRIYSFEFSEGDVDKLDTTRKAEVDRLISCLNDEFARYSLPIELKHRLSHVGFDGRFKVI